MIGLTSALSHWRSLSLASPLSPIVFTYLISHHLCVIPRSLPLSSSSSLFLCFSVVCLGVAAGCNRSPSCPPIRARRRDAAHPAIQSTVKPVALSRPELGYRNRSRSLPPRAACRRSSSPLPHRRPSLLTATAAVRNCFPPSSASAFRRLPISDGPSRDEDPRRQPPHGDHQPRHSLEPPLRLCLSPSPIEPRQAFSSLSFSCDRSRTRDPPFFLLRWLPRTGEAWAQPTSPRRGCRSLVPDLRCRGPHTADRPSPHARTPTRTHRHSHTHTH